MTTLADLFSGNQDPSYDARQIVGHGIVGQGLAKQRQQLDNAGAPDPAAQTRPGTPYTPDTHPMIAIPPQPSVRQGFTYLNPSDWTPQERALFNQAHGIAMPQQQQGMLGHIMQLLGMGQASAATPPQQ